MSSLRRVYRIMNSIDGDLDAWFAFLERMASSIYEHVRSMAGEAVAKHKDAPKEWGAIVSEAKKSLSFLDGPMFAGLEKPDFSLAVLTEKRCNVYINIPVEYLGIWSPFLRLVIGVAMLYKQRKPQAERIVYMIDECAQLGPSPPFLLRALTFGRGCGNQCFLAYQSFGQLSAQLGHDGAQTAISSCPLIQVFGIRDYETAQLVSRILGTQSLSYRVDLDQAAARRNKAHIARELLNGADPFEAGLNYAQQARAAVNRQMMARLLATPDELLRMPKDRQIIIPSGIDCPPISALTRAYYRHKELIGKWLPNGYYGPTDHITVPGLFGKKKLRVITEPVPEWLKDYPQFQDGFISFIEGYRPY